MLILALAAWARAAWDQTEVDFGVAASWDLYYVANSSNARWRQPLDDDWLDGYWMQTIGTEFRVDAKIRERLAIEILYYGAILFTAPGEYADRPDQDKKGYGAMRSAHATYEFGSGGRLPVRLTAGYFPFYYVPRYQLFGGYLFNTGVYPGYVLSNRSISDETGFMLETDLPARLRHNLFCTFELTAPLHDLSLTYLARWGIDTPLEIGAGIMLHRLLRTDQGNDAYRRSISHRENRYYYLDPSSPGDTVFYRKAGIKGVGRVALSIGKLLASKRLGPEDLTLYTEAAVLGVTDFGDYYNDITERMPVMAGITLPSFGLLDVAGVEAEYYGSPWKNNTGEHLVPYYGFEPNTARNSGFLPIDDPSTQDAGDKATTDNIKWAFFAKRSIKEKFVIDLRVASDHFRCPAGTKTGFEATERLHAPDEWYIQIGFATRF
ncbi:MAG: hypothetical protein GF410_01730 [Chitinivibrionales bacterium]|nr:hypothetical protein [Chitinivibrionales bacterium]